MLEAHFYVYRTQNVAMLFGMYAIESSSTVAKNVPIMLNLMDMFVVFVDLL
jgi:hypothetical protein